MASALSLCVVSAKERGSSDSFFKKDPNHLLAAMMAPSHLSESNSSAATFEGDIGPS